MVIGESITYPVVHKEQMKTCYPCVEEFKSDESEILKVKAICTKNSINYKIGKIVTRDNFINSETEKARISAQIVAELLESRN